MYKDFSHWSIYEGNSFGSGTSQQEWIVNKETNEIGLFKDRKSEETTDNFSEKIASEIANKIGLSCARIDLATRDNRIGVVSYKINSQEEDILEGIQFINRVYPFYNKDTLIDEETGEKYSLDIVLNSIRGLNLESELFKVFIFDFIIGNTDRHHSNWAILMNGGDISICPLYDNASSLCSYVTDEQIDRSIRDKNWVNALIDSKSKSLIRINGNKVRHSEFVRYLSQRYYLETVSFVKDIKEKLTNSVIDEILNAYNGVLSDKKIILLKIYLKEKIKILLDIYKISLD